MFSWLLVNIVLTLLALLFVTLNASAPHRLRFLVSFIALLAWLMPWHLIPEFLPRWYALDLLQIENQLKVNTAEYSLKPVVIMQTGTPLVAAYVVAFTLVEIGFGVLCMTGLVLFLYHLGQHHIRLSQLRRRGEDGAAVLRARGLASPVPVIVQNEISGAFSSGLLTPRIWVHKELADSAQLATLLRHELTHIRQHDNWYLLFITLVEKLFWWNPLVWLLGRQVRELQELSCDVLCQRASADYPLHLAELMMDNARLAPTRSSLLLSANIFNRTNLNIKRIKLLQRSYAMKPRHLVSTLATAVCALATIGVVTAQPEAGATHVFIRGQTGQQAIDAEGNVVFIARDPAQPLTEEEVPAFEGTRFFFQTDEATASGQDVFIAPRQMVGWNAGTPGAMDQYIKVNGNGDKTEISFNFTDTPLPMILEPLANMAANDDVAAFGVAAASAMPGSPAGMHIMTRARVAGSGIGTVAAGEAGVADFYLVTPPNGPQPFNVRVGGVTTARVAESFTMPLSSRLVIEDEADKERLVSANAENVSIEAALEIIGAEANCNIFLEDDKIVVNSCAN